jgi:hypothetical protein
MKFRLLFSTATQNTPYSGTRVNLAQMMVQRLNGPKRPLRIVFVVRRNPRDIASTLGMADRAIPKANDCDQYRIEFRQEPGEAASCTMVFKWKLFPGFVRAEEHQCSPHAFDSPLK